MNTEDENLKGKQEHIFMISIITLPYNGTFETTVKGNIIKKIESTTTTEATTTNIPTTQTTTNIPTTQTTRTTTTIIINEKTATTEAESNTTETIEKNKRKKRESINQKKINLDVDSLLVIGQPLRLDHYAEQSSCVRNTEVESICYCYNNISNINIKTMRTTTTTAV